MRKITLLDSILSESKKDLGNRIEGLCNLTGLNKDQLVKLLDSTEPTLKGVFKGGSQYAVDNLFNISFIFGMTIDELSNPRLQHPSNYREILIDYHKFIDSGIYYGLKSNRPSIEYAIERVLKSDILNEPKQAGEISAAMQILLGVEYDPTSLNAPLQRYNDAIMWHESPNNRGHYKYQLKKPFKQPDENGKHTPIYIKMSQTLEKPTPFRVLHHQVMIMLRLKDRNDSGKSIIRSTNTLSFNQRNVENYLAPLLDSALITIVEKAGKDDHLYSLTEKGRSVLNL